MFYTFPMAKFTNHVRFPEDHLGNHTFVAIKDRPVKRKIRSMYIVDSVREDTTMRGFKYEHLSTHTLIYIDSITAKVKLVPHYDDSKKNELMCGIPMWEAR